jgi:hypothetical protein
MDAAEYAEQQQTLTAGLVAIVLRILKPYKAPAVSLPDWKVLLDIIFPYVDSYRKRSAQLGRDFYDSQREKHQPELPRHDVLLPKYKPEWFVEAMEPARKSLMKPGASDHAVNYAALRAMKEVENGGRRAILRAVGTDPVRPRWARVATGRETCGFCMTMVSRGPVYHTAEDAGLDADDTTATELWERVERNHGEDSQVAEEAMAGLMRRWHAGCDCKVVPVFDRKNWSGRDAYLRAERLWRETTKGYTGRDALNAFRRAVENGEIDVQEFAVAA